MEHASVVLDLVTEDNIRKLEMVQRKTGLWRFTHRSAKSSTSLPNGVYTIHGHTFEKVSSAKYLGVTL